MSFVAEYSFAKNGNHHRDTIAAADGDEALRRCSLGFNPDGNANAFLVKLACAGAMQAIVQSRKDEVLRHEGRMAEIADMEQPARRLALKAEDAGHGDAMRCFATALTHLETAQMFGVAGVYAPANATR